MDLKMNRQTFLALFMKHLEIPKEDNIERIVEATKEY